MTQALRNITYCLIILLIGCRLVLELVEIHQSAKE